MTQPRLHQAHPEPELRARDLPRGCSDSKHGRGAPDSFLPHLGSRPHASDGGADPHGLEKQHLHVHEVLGEGLGVQAGCGRD